MKKMTYLVHIGGTNADAAGELLNWLINQGLAHAQTVVEQAGPDAEIAQRCLDLHIHAPVQLQDTSSVEVAYWDAYHLEDGCTMTHQIDVVDQRASNGQIYLDIGAAGDESNDSLAITAEINTNPLTGIEHVPCVHVHFDGDNLAFSVFKIADRLVLRPETGVVFEHDSIAINRRPESVVIVQNENWETARHGADLANKDLFLCQHCGGTFDNDDSVSTEVGLVCVHCADRKDFIDHMATWKHSANDTSFREWMLTENLSQCGNCSSLWHDSELREAKHLTMRVSPGEAMPSGECPSCGALCHLTSRP